MDGQQAHAAGQALHSNSIGTEFRLVDWSVMGRNQTGILRRSVQYTPIATIITDYRLQDNPIVEANDAFVDLTGYPRDEIIGRNCRFLAGHGTEAEAQSALREAIKDGKTALVEITNYRKDGTPFRNAVMLAPIRDEDGSISMFIGSQMELATTGAGGRLRSTRARDLVARLTPRLRQTLELVAMGYRNKEIAGRLGIGEKTVKMHRARLLEALNVKTNADAIRIAVEAETPSAIPADRETRDGGQQPG